jgi:Recombination endonuclease VII
MDSEENKKLLCPAFNCNASFTRNFNLNRHYERYHMNVDIAEKCLLCGRIFVNCNELQQHYKRVHKPTKNFVIKESAFRKSVVTYRYTFNSNFNDLNIAQQAALPAILSLITGEAAKKTLIKVGLIIICQMSMLDHVGDKMTTTMIPFRAPSFLVNGFNTAGLKRNVLRSFLIHEKDMEEFCNCGSNWVFDRAMTFDIEIAAMRPILIGQDSDSTETSEILTEDDEENNRSEFYDTREAKKFNMRNIKNNKFLFNPSNYDDKCFLYCVFRHLKFTHARKKYRGWSFKRFEKSINVSGIQFPISIPHIIKFCRQNSNLNLRINIILLNSDNHVFPLEYGLGRKNKSNTMNLLLVQRKTETEETNNHFLLITNMHKFLRKTYHDGSYQRSYTCVNCMNGFSSMKILNNHEKICCLHKPRIETVSDEKIMKFQNYQNKHPLEYIAFLDFECVLPITAKKCPECTHLHCKCDRSYTEPVADQHPITYCLVILDHNGEIIHKKIHSGENAADHLINHLLHEEELWISNLFSDSADMSLTKRDWITYNQSTQCYMCNTTFNDCVVKCRDHCHFTGKFLGAACQSCNLRRRRPRKLNIFLHNGSKYDFHFIIKAIHNKPGIQNINILPYNGENFRTVSFNSFMFVDSMSFLQNSLAKLSNDLANTDNPYSILRQTNLVKTNGSFSRTKYQSVLGKSFFPYEYW